MVSINITTAAGVLEQDLRLLEEILLLLEEVLWSFREHGNVSWALLGGPKVEELRRIAETLKMLENSYKMIQRFFRRFPLDHKELVGGCPST